MLTALRSIRLSGEGSSAQFSFQFQKLIDKAPVKLSRFKDQQKKSKLKILDSQLIPEQYKRQTTSEFRSLSMKKQKKNKHYSNIIQRNYRLNDEINVSWSQAKSNPYKIQSKNISTSEVLNKTTAKLYGLIKVTKQTLNRPYLYANNNQSNVSSYEIKWANHSKQLSSKQKQQYLNEDNIVSKYLSKNKQFHIKKKNNRRDYLFNNSKQSKHLRDSPDLRCRGLPLEPWNIVTPQEYFQ